MSTSDFASEQPDRAGTGPGSGPPRPVVTLAAYYGAGGAVVGPRVAERLGVAFLDRGIPSAVAERMGVPEEAASGYDEQSQGGAGRLLASLARTPISDAVPMDSLELDEHRYRAETEEFIASAAMTGGVVLGRAAFVILAQMPGALHVLLGGPREARIRQAMEIERVDRATAERRLRANDWQREEHIRRTYGVDPRNPDNYHLRIDTTAVGLGTCVDLIVAASQGRMRQAHPAGHG